jgi:predicted dehydrogenase
MKALIIGYGSIGSRHARALDSLGLDVAVVSRRDVDVKKTYTNIAGALADEIPDYVIVASRTHDHHDDLSTLAEAGYNGTVLVEKPLFHTGQDVPGHSFKDAFVAYNLRFHPVLRRFKEILNDSRPHAVHAYVGQYLPDWRPDTDYRKGYSASRAEGGGVLRDLSHELDYLNWMLDGWTQLTAMGGHVSGLEIDSDDVFSVLLETRLCPVVSVQMNYLDSALRREVLALTDRGTISADLVLGTIEFDGNIETFPVESDTTYIAQHKAATTGDKGTLCTLTEGLAVVGMIDAAEMAASKGIWVAA